MSIAIRTKTTRNGSVCYFFRFNCLYQCEAVAVTGHEYRRNKKKKIKEEATGKYFKQLATSSQQDTYLKTKQETRSQLFHSYYLLCIMPCLKMLV